MNNKSDTAVSPAGIAWPELKAGTLVKRYKRFLADVILDTGDTVTAHCPNSGSMAACSEPGRPVFVSFHDNPKRKLKYTWELIDMPTSLVGVNTMLPNRLVKKSIQQGLIKELDMFDMVVSEVKTGNNSRLDLMLSNRKNEKCFVEIKNCTLVNDSIACFPDAVTTRGRKHLIELQKLVLSGYRCVIFFLIQRMDATLFKPADHIDPEYGQELRKAIKNGVEILIYDTKIDLKRITLNREIGYTL